MRRKIPSTIALAVFEAAARQGSFARAANEVCLTESAVSRQIATLETYLGVKLFTRVRKQVILNDAGRLYLKNIARNLSDIEAHTAALMAHKGVGGVLELAVIPTFANRWLLPRLRDFREQHPDIILNLSERPLPFSFDETNFDAALNFDHPSWTNVVKVDLFDEELVPIISPRYFDTLLLNAPADLTRFPLLHKSTRPEAWKHWFEMTGVSDFTPVPGMHFELYGMVIEAARAGLGAGLVPKFYVQDEIERNDLVIPFDLSLKHEKRYCLVYPERKKDSELVQVFRDWVVSIGVESGVRLE